MEAWLVADERVEHIDDVARLADAAKLICQREGRPFAVLELYTQIALGDRDGEVLERFSHSTPTHCYTISRLP